jgi:hypothetical protein
MFNKKKKFLIQERNPKKKEKWNNYSRLQGDSASPETTNQSIQKPTQLKRRIIITNCMNIKV